MDAVNVLFDEVAMRTVGAASTPGACTSGLRLQLLLVEVVLPHDDSALFEFLSPEVFDGVVVPRTYRRVGLYV